MWSLAVFWIGNGIMYLVYKYEPAFMEPYRVSDSWPWKGSAKVRRAFPPRLRFAPALATWL